MAKKRAGQGGTQMGLPTLEWFACKCGCGNSFLQNDKGRTREYLNDSHKKRAYRDRLQQKERNDIEAEAAWKGWSNEAITEYIMGEPEGYLAWLGQWELYRRASV